MGTKTPVRLRLRQLICGNIADGVWKPGDRLPGRETLARQYRVSLRSLQQAVDDLISDGHLVSHGGHGTLVAEHPPCLFRIALLTPEEKEPGLAHNLRQVAEHWDGPDRFVCLPLTSLSQLTDDLPYYHFRGAIVHQELQYLSAVEREPLRGLPLVVIGFMTEGFARLHLDLYASIEWGLKHLASAGHQRVAVISTRRPSDQLQQRSKGWFEALGITYDRRLFLEIDGQATHVANNLIPLLWSLPGKERPQALLITDDHLVPAVTAALKSVCGKRPPAILAHANHPIMSHSELACERYGFRAHDILGNARDLLAMATSNEPPIRTLLPSLFT